MGREEEKAMPEIWMDGTVKRELASFFVVSRFNLPCLNGIRTVEGVTVTNFDGATRTRYWVGSMVIANAKAPSLQIGPPVLQSCTEKNPQDSNVKIKSEERIDIKVC